MDPFENFDPAALLDRMHSQPGPMQGSGRGPGRRWGGIIERTPGLWVVWIADAAKRAGVDPTTIRIEWGGSELRLCWVDLTFGRRYYFRCPLCARRVEAVYNAGRVGCRHCLRLGYASQAQRPGSIYRVLDLVTGRHWPGLSGRYTANDQADELVKTMGREFRAKLDSAFETLKIESTEVIDDGPSEPSSEFDDRQEEPRGME